MGLFKDDAPKPPDPYKVADAQTKSNKETAQEQARLAMTGQTSDFGSLSYVVDPTSPSGYRAVSTLSPEDQALLAQQRDTGANLGNLTNTTLNNARATIGGPFDLTAARGKEISDIQQTFLDPQFQQREAAMKSDLLNRGIREGSEQYETAMRQFHQQRDDSYNKMFLDAFGVANNAALTERNLPLDDFMKLTGAGRPVSGLPAPNTPAPGVATTPVGQYIMDNYKAQMDQYNNQSQGLYGLAGTLGSAAVKYGPAMIAASDRRLKTQARRVGKLDNGLHVWAFEYKAGGPPQLGLMADEVKKLHPEAVVNVDGFDYVNYDQAVL